ncbi:hypothetical protein JXO52_04620 [bacterium]|nr:hypothetical protein [bacterium]
MKGMSVIVKQISRLMYPSILVLGVYIILHGHLTPGGGFAGGVLIAGAFTLLVLAYGADEVTTARGKWRATLGESIGIFLFWFIAVLGIVQGGYFFLNMVNHGEPLQLFSAGIIPLCNIAIGIEVSAALFAIFITMSVLKLGDKV